MSDDDDGDGSRPVVESQCYVFSFRYSLPAWADEGDRASAKDFIVDDWRSRCDDYIFQLEYTDGVDTKGPSKGYGYEHGNWHFQGYFKLKTKQRASSLHWLYNTCLRGAEVTPASNSGKDRLRNYAMKTDTRRDGPWGKRRIYKGDDLPTVLHPWQAAIVKTLTGPIPKRVINWYWDKTGNIGKTAIAKYMCFHHGAVYFTPAKAGDILNLWSKHDSDVYIFALPRTMGTSVRRETPAAAATATRRRRSVGLAAVRGEIGVGGRKTRKRHHVEGTGSHPAPRAAL